MSKIARIYQGINEIQKYYQGGVLQRLFFDWKHYIGNELNIEYAKECAGRNVVISGKTYQNLFKAELSQGHVNSSLTAQQNLRVNSEGFNLSAKKFTISVSAGFEVLVYPNYVDNKSGFSPWKNKIVWGNSSETNNIRIMVRKPDNSEITVDEVIGKVILLEGDYTNTDLPTSIDGIESVAEREFVKSKNLFDKNAIIQGKYQNFNKTTTNFNITPNANYCISGFIKIKPQANYIFSKQGGAASHEGGAFYDKNKKPIVTESISGGVSSITSPENAYYMVLNFFKAKINTIIDTIQIEEGTTATEYEPFYKYYPATIRNYNYKCDTDNIVLPNGVKNSIDTIDGKKVHVQRVGHVKFVDLSWNRGSMTNYYQFICSDIGRKPSTGIADMISNHKILSQNSSDIGYYLKPTSPSGSVPKGIQLQFIQESNINNLENLYLYLQEGDYYLYYELEAPIYTYLESGIYDDITIPSSNIKNEIYLENGKWYRKRNIGKTIFDGSSDENWYYDTTFKRFNSPDIKDCIYKNGRTPVYIKGYTYSDKSGDNFDTLAFLSGANNLCKLYINNYAYTSVKDFRAYLAKNPLEVYYELAEPVISELPFSDITYKLNESLRSLPNGVCDTIEGNKLIQRVGKVILDGSADESWSLRANAESSNFIYFHSSFSTMNKSFTDYTQSKNRMICDKLLVSSNAGDNIAKEQCICGRGSGHGFCIALLKSNLETVDLTGFLKWLSENPVTVYYELAAPIETEITPDKILINGEPITDTIGVELPNGERDSIYNRYYVKRVGKVVLDGSDDEEWTIERATNKLMNAGILIESAWNKSREDIASGKIDYYFFSDKLPNQCTSITSTASEGIMLHFRLIYVRILLSKLSSQDIDGLRNYLSENPITVWYELATPVKIPLFSIKEGLTTLKSTNNITPQIELDCLVRDGFQNMCDNVWEVGNINNSTGNNQDMGGRIRLVNYIYVKPNTKYRLDIVNKVNGNYIGIRYYDSSKVYISYKSMGSIKSSTFTFTIPENCYYIRFIAETTDTNFKIYLKEVIN